MGFAPRIVARIVQAHNGRHTLRGHARARRRRGSQRATLRLIRKVLFISDGRAAVGE